MSDPENGPSLAPETSRGPTIHAVEGMVIGIFAVAWVYTPLRSSFAPVPLLDELLVLPVGVLACANLLLCTLVPSNEPPQAAFFALTLTAFLGYLLVALEAQSFPHYTAVFFGTGLLFQIPAGISLALLAVQALLAAGAVCHRLWLQTQWQEGTLLLIATLLSCLCLRQGVHVAPAVLLLILVLLALASLCVVTPALRPRWLAHLAVYTCLVVFSNALAYASASTLWLHPAMTLLLWLLVVHKFVVPRAGPQSAYAYAQLPARSPAAAAPPSLVRRAVFVPPPVAPQPSAARIQGDAILFGGRSVVLRSKIH